ncbi:hypothetical protein, partial [Enterobacter hormaechei]|uniref:hypothetical protein n=1 Tax=Enterobacter hormaechei TaxID=158836 RepID=UPI0033161F43
PSHRPHCTINVMPPINGNFAQPLLDKTPLAAASFAASPKRTFYLPIASTQVVGLEKPWPECA